MDSRRRPSETSLELAKSTTKSNNSEVTEGDRLALLLTILRDAHLATGREMPEKTERGQILRVWAEITAVIPASLLRESFIFAMRERGDAMGMLSPSELVKASRSILAARAAAPPQYAPERRPDDVLAPDEVAAQARALRESLEARGLGFRKAGDVAILSPRVRCIACALDYDAAANTAGCPRCRLREMAEKEAPNAV